MDWPFLIILSGPPSVGKNTIAAKICNEFPLKIAEIDLDKVKELITEAPSTDIYLDIASDVGQSMTRIFLKSNISVVVHKAFCSFLFVQPFIDIAKEMNVKYYYFKLSAPLAELIKRNKNRLRSSKVQDLKRIYHFDKISNHAEGIKINTKKTGIEDTLYYILNTIASST